MSQGVITALEIQKRDKERVNIFVDGAFAFSLTLLEAARLHKGQVLAEAEIEALRSEDAVLRAVDSAARLLSYRPRSVAEVRRNLAEKEIPAAVIDAAVERLKAMGYLDDAAFARFWVQNRGEFKPLSQKALRQELRQKGIADAVIRETLDEVSESQLAYKAAQSQLRRLRPQNRKTFQSKLASFLQRRGFSYSTTRDAIQRLLDELDEQDPDYFHDDMIERDEE